ncbi:MAG: carbohydrate kinase family protein [Desulfovibrio sp.]|nr:carbohydrate kinase family protein [Desulfovibrio sp.]MCA1987181.1 carbohydrate kinase family protein [Desulfovibrio sp.]
MRIYVSGSLAYDRIMNFPGRFADHILPDKLHILNVCFLVDGLSEKFGGTAGNIAYTLVLLGKAPLILSAAGKDFGAYEAHLRKLGLSLEGIRHVDEEFTASAYITTDRDDNQITGFNPGAMRQPCIYEIGHSQTGGALAIIGPGNLQDMTTLPERFNTLNIPYIFDPGQQIPALTGEQLKRCIAGARIFISNDYEMEMVCKSTGLTKAEVTALPEICITTLGEKGSVCRNGQGLLEIDAVPAREVKDPTGAGDAYRAGLICGLVDGMDLTAACRMGATAAAFCVEQHGTQEHRFTQDEFWSRYPLHLGDPR